MSQRKKPKRASRTKSAAPNNSGSRLTLSQQQERFVFEYLNTRPLNATKAYELAGYRATGQAARTAASRLLKQAAVQAAIARYREQDAAKYAVSRENVVAQYAKIAFSDPRNFFHNDGHLLHPIEMDDASAASLVQYEVQEEYADLPSEEELENQPHGGKLKRRAKRRISIGRITKVKWQDKRAALDSIVRIMGYAKDNGNLGTPENPLTVMLAEMQNRKSALLPICDDPGEDEEP